MGEFYETVWDAFSAGEFSRRAALTDAERAEEDRIAAEKAAAETQRELARIAVETASRNSALELLDPVLTALADAGALTCLGAYAVRDLRYAARMGGAIVLGGVENVMHRNRKGQFSVREWVSAPSTSCVATAAATWKKTGGVVTVGLTETEILAVIMPGFGQETKTRVLRAPR
jgi:hypothetical protein